MITTELQWREHRKYFGNMGARFPFVFWCDLSKPFLFLAKILVWICFHRSEKNSFSCGSTHWLGTVFFFFFQLRSASTGKSHGASSQSESERKSDMEASRESQALRDFKGFFSHLLSFIFLPLRNFKVDDLWLINSTKQWSKIAKRDFDHQEHKDIFWNANCEHAHIYSLSYIRIFSHFILYVVIFIDLWLLPKELLCHTKVIFL